MPRDRMECDTTVAIPISKYQLKQRRLRTFKFVNQPKNGQQEMIASMIQRSENYETPDKVRTAIRHDMVDIAIKQADDRIWVDVGEALIRAAEQDDLVPRVSDRFVEACPDTVFEGFHIENAACRFVAWRRKTLQAHGLW